MTVVPLPLDPGAKPERERLLTFDAGTEDLEDTGDAEPDDHDEPDALPCCRRHSSP
jgi:hypothetical protein